MDIGFVVIILAVGTIAYLRYRAAKKFSEDNDPEANKTTLFDGDK